MTTKSIPTLIKKLRTAPQTVGTFGRGDPNPLDEYRLVLTGEERDWLIAKLQTIEVMEQAGKQYQAAAEKVRRGIV